MPQPPEHVVIVGGGLAGARAAQELRGQGHVGRITLVGAEQELPYDRPPLSKQVLLGRADDSTLDVDWPALAVDLRLGVRATRLRPGVLETDRKQLGWDALVLATGAQPRPLPGVDGVGQPLHLLRTRSDALRLRAQLRAGAHVVVVGAGWIGAEVATAAAAAGCRTTVVEAAATPLGGALGEDVGRRTVPWYAAAGVQLLLSAAVAAVDRRGVVLQDGTTVRADAVVVGIGAEPATRWLGSAVPLDGRGAVLTDEHLATAVPGVVAVGDCCSWWSRRFADRLHVEHWDDALQAPAVAAGTLLGRQVVHDPVPYFWSEQLGHIVQFAGHVQPGDRVVHRVGRRAGHGSTDGSTGGWSVCWLRGDRLVGVAAVDRPRDLLKGRRAIAAGHCPDPARLADPDVPLELA